MQRPYVVLSLGLVAICIMTLFQNCGAPTGLDENASTRDLTNVTRSSQGDSQFMAPTWSISDIPSEQEPTIYYAKANGVTELTTANPENQVTWEWQTRTPVVSGRSRIYNCPNTSLNSNVEFSWANGTTAGTILGSSRDSERAGCSQEVCFVSSTETTCVTVRYLAPELPSIDPEPESAIYLKANGAANHETSSRSVIAFANQAVRWSWNTSSPVLRGHSTVFNCRDSSINGSAYFDWANGTTSGNRLGSSSDYRRDGCMHRVCLDTETTTHCVNVEYTMPQSWGAMANGKAGVVYRNANQATTWMFKTTNPIEKGTYEITRCHNPSFNAAKGEFTWANGKTDVTELGSSSDPGRVGCHQEVCVMNSQENYCVMVIYQ